MCLKIFYFISLYSKLTYFMISSRMLSGTTYYNNLFRIYLIWNYFYYKNEE